MEVLLIGGGIGGLAAALCLHEVGIGCRIFEASREHEPAGVGINLQSHAVKELALLGLEDELIRGGVALQEKAFFNSHGQKIFAEPMGRFAGHEYPHITIHRADLLDVLLRAVRERLGRDAVAMGRSCVGFEQDSRGVTAHFVDAACGGNKEAIRADIAVGCDGLHSVIRRQLHPHEPDPIYSGHMSWRGLARSRPFLSGTTIAFVGAYDTALFAAYPVRSYPDGSQLINLITSLPKKLPVGNDFDKQGRLSDFIDPFRGWNFDWIDVPRELSKVNCFLELPLVDRDPLDHWTCGRVTLLGDAAHPMSPRGSNGAAQAILDGAGLARALASETNVSFALERYDAQRRPATSEIVLTNRESPPDTIISHVEGRTGGRRFDDITKIADRDELRRISENYKRVTGALGG
jgi:5-methylphenazine-1-carboxylate 1-monooxygenase